MKISKKTLLNYLLTILLWKFSTLCFPAPFENKRLQDIGLSLDVPENFEFTPGYSQVFTSPDGPIYVYIVPFRKDISEFEKKFSKDGLKLYSRELLGTETINVDGQKRTLYHIRQLNGFKGEKYIYFFGTDAGNLEIAASFPDNSPSETHQLLKESLLSAKAIQKSKSGEPLLNFKFKKPERLAFYQVSVNDIDIGPLYTVKGKPLKSKDSFRLSISMKPSKKAKLKKRISEMDSFKLERVIETGSINLKSGQVATYILASGRFNTVQKPSSIYVAFIGKEIGYYFTGIYPHSKKTPSEVKRIFENSLATFEIVD